MFCQGNGSDCKGRWQKNRSNERFGFCFFLKSEFIYLLLERAIKRNPLFEFLEDALTDWPEKDKHNDAVDENNEEAVNEEDDEGIVDDEIIEDDMDVDELNEENPVQITTESESLTEVLIED